MPRHSEMMRYCPIFLLDLLRVGCYGKYLTLYGGSHFATYIIQRLTVRLWIAIYGRMVDLLKIWKPTSIRPE